MIAVVSSQARERAALAALCDGQDWPTVECESLRAFLRNLRRHAPRIVLVRQKLGDGYADDVLAHLRAAARLPATKVIVLIPAGTSSGVEARLLALGADCVQRDPVRIDVLVEYLKKYYAAAPNGAVAAKAAAGRAAFAFAGAQVCPATRMLSRGKKTVQLTPRELALVEMFASAAGDIVSYESFYSEILGQRFRGDTSNMRVLVGKLTVSTASLGLPLRRWISVIPKAGYRYHPPGNATAE